MIHLYLDKRDTRANRSNLPSDDRAWWQAHHDRVERVAKEAAGLTD
jgi:hypothetical protein